MSEIEKKIKLSDEQKNVVNAMMNQQVFVRAGAGTGKTATMVAGIVEKLRECSDEEKNDFFNHVFMVTFTDNAASELKTRLRKKILEDDNPLIRKQAERVEGAWVSTIHGLCSRILRMYAIEAGINQDFKVCSESERFSLLHQACDEITLELCAQPEYKALFSFFGFEKKGSYGSQTASDMAYQIAEKLTECSNSEALQWVNTDKKDTQNAIKRFSKKVFSLWEKLIEMYLADKPTEKGLVYVEEQQTKLKSIEAALKEARSLEEKLYLLAQIPTPSGTYVKKDKYKDLKEEIKETRSQLLSCLCYLVFFQPLQVPLFEFAKKIQSRFDELKERAGFLDNNDLLTKCYKFLQEKKPSICHSFTLAIVDEFQDTNEQQLSIIKMLAKERKALCFVGDAQQSIYRFRGADVDLYNKVKEEIEKEGEGIFDLTTNYRSHSDILTFVEEISNDSSVLTDFLSLSVPEKTEAIEPSNIEECIQTNPLWNRKRIFVECTLAKGVGRSNRHRRANDSQVAERVAEMINDDIKPKDIAVLTRTAKEADYFARSLYEVGCDVMRVNQKNKNVAEFDEIEHLLIALANPADTKNGVLPLLAGPMFEIPYDDLVLISKGSEVVHLPDFFMKSSKEVKDEVKIDLDERTYRAFDTLSSLRSLRKQLSVAELVEYVCVQSGWLARISRDFQNRTEKAANLFNAFDVIREIIDNAGLGLSSAPEVFSLWRKDEKGRAALLNSSDSGAITVETVYQSKGLQYPIVVVAGEALLNKWKPDRNLLMTSFEGKTYMMFKIALSERQMLHYVNEKISSKIKKPLDNKVLSSILNNMKFDVQSYSEEDVKMARKELKEGIALLPYEGIKRVSIIEEEADNSETWRLLYVAMTRAQNGLIICMPQRVNTNQIINDTSLFMDRFNEVLGLPGDLKEDEYDFYIDNLPVHIRKDILEGEGQIHPDVALVEDFKVEDFLMFDINEKMLPKIPWGYMQDVGSFSADSHQTEEMTEEEQDKQLEIIMNCRDRKKAARAIIESIEGKPEFEFGSAFHELAEVAALQKDEPSAKQITARAMFHRLDVEKTKALEQAVHSWWNSALRKEAYALPNLEPEYPFFMKDDVNPDKPYKRGFIDLLAFDGTRALVVDYKTGEHNLSEVEAKEIHAAQCAWYARALLLIGFTEVTVKFILVQNVNDVGEPLVVDFGTYTKETMPEIEVAKGERRNESAYRSV